MKRRALRDSSMLPDELGQDSFLDTISNLVGVLIILVVVVGAHARKINTASHDLESMRTEVASKAEAARDAARTHQNLLSEFGELERQIVEEDRLGQLRAMERSQILVFMAEIENQLNTLSQSRTEAERIALERATAADRLKSEIQTVQATIHALETDKPVVEAIDHYPTPIAKTVFRDDVHFRLKGGRISFVPLEELIQKMRGEWKAKAEKLGQASRIAEIVGPIDGFRMQYVLTRRQVTQATSAGPVAQQLIEFDHFTVLPPSDSIGEPVATALQSTSAFSQQLARLQPEKHTISVWVYPDSYREFHELKKWLYERGFQTATWPLSADGQITGGPKGQRSAAQ